MPLKDIRNTIKFRVKSDLTNALTYFNLLEYQTDDPEYASVIDEYEAGIEMIDVLIDDDGRFSSTNALRSVRTALAYFFDALDDAALRRLKVACLLDDLDVIAAEAGR